MKLPSFLSVFLFSLTFSVFSFPILLASAGDFSTTRQEDNANLKICPIEIENDLSSRHPALSLDSLLELTSNNEDSLVSCLIHLRLKSKPPFLGPRAEKLLITFEDREDVRRALIEDVSDDSRMGLGSIVLSSIPNIKNESLRKELVLKSRRHSKTTTNKLVAERYDAILESLPEEYRPEKYRPEKYR